MNKEMEKVFKEYCLDQETFKQMENFFCILGIVFLLLPIVIGGGVLHFTHTDINIYTIINISPLYFIIVLPFLLIAIDLIDCKEMLFSKGKSNKILKTIAKLFYKKDVYTDDSRHFTYGKYNIIPKYSVKKQIETNYVTSDGTLIQDNIHYYLSIPSKNTDIEINYELYKKFETAFSEKAVMIVENEELEKAMLFTNIEFSS